MNKLESLPNIGKKIASRLRQIDIHTVDEFLKRDLYEIFYKLQQVDTTACRCVFASIVGAKMRIPWHTITKTTAKKYERKNPTHRWGKC
ncbi:MAG: TfoX/Sxy family DNA transformation protein [bacterium]